MSAAAERNHGTSAESELASFGVGDDEISFNSDRSIVDDGDFCGRHQRKCSKRRGPGLNTEHDGAARLAPLAVLWTIPYTAHNGPARLAPLAVLWTIPYTAHNGAARLAPLAVLWTIPYTAHNGAARLAPLAVLCAYGPTCRYAVWLEALPTTTTTG